MTILDKNFEDPFKPIAEGVNELALAYVETLDEMSRFIPMGMKKPSSEQMYQFGLAKEVAFPPRLWMTPTGVLVEASAWALALHMENVVNGDEWLKPLKKAAKEHGPDATS